MKVLLLVLRFIDPHFYYFLYYSFFLMASFKGTLQKLEKNILGIYLRDQWCHHLKKLFLTMITTLKN